MDKQLPSLLSQNTKVQEYMGMLKSMGYKEQEKDTGDLIKHIDNLEKQFEIVIGELKEMHNTIQQLQNPTTRLNLNTLINKIDNSVQFGKNRLIEIKKSFVNSISSSLQSVKLVGKDTIIKTVDVLHVQEGLKNVHHSVAFAIKGISNFNMRLNQVAIEARHAKLNIKNVGRLLIGKSVNSSQIDKTKLNLLQRLGKSTQSSLERLQASVYKTSNYLTDLNKRSVKTDLKTFEHTKAKANTPNLTMKKIENLPR